MAEEHIDPPELPASPDNSYNHVVKAGNTAYTTGQVSRALCGQTIHAGDPEAQIHRG